MGDLLDTEIHPGQGESAGVFYSNVKGWLQILDNIMARNLPVETYVPGHGPAHIGRGAKIWRSRSATSWSCATKSRR